MKTLFVVHASEDKEAVARPIARMLTGRGFHVWYDEYSIQLGDSLRQIIERAISACDYGVVILSKKFFQRSWPQYELDGLTAREMSTKRKIILPVWHEISQEELLELAPALSSKLAAETSFGIPFVVNMIEEAIVADVGGVEDSPSAILFGFQSLRFVRCPQCGRPFRSPSFPIDRQQILHLGPCPHCGYP